MKRSGRDAWLGVAGRPGAEPGLAQAFEAGPAEVAASDSVALRARDERPLHWESYGQP